MNEENWVFSYFMSQLEGNRFYLEFLPFIS
jgi:hypothetical protein